MNTEALRASALEALGDYGDPRARRALLGATVSVEPSTLRWASSAGEEAADRVIVGVDARSLGALEAAPAALDALRAAVARAVAEVSGRSLADLELRWNGLPAGPEGYRGTISRPGTEEAALALALERWCEGFLGALAGPWTVRVEGEGRLRLGAPLAVLLAHGEDARRGLMQLSGRAVTLEGGTLG
ncbi:MAG: hypothetical protein HY909_00390 [Deltaproteobacteria bacterium]|nr:hypothetical protein [Deltaproteobacteria bacterium]